MIAECKRRSPSRGILRADYRPEEIAAAYARNGAAAVSVLTEPTFFDGSLDHLRAVRAAVGIPVLRKDFIVAPYQLLEAAAAGADAVLLIAAALDDADLGALHARAGELGLGVLVESARRGRARPRGAGRGGGHRGEQPQPADPGRRRRGIAPARRTDAGGRDRGSPRAACGRVPTSRGWARPATGRS